MRARVVVAVTLVLIMLAAPLAVAQGNDKTQEPQDARTEDESGDPMMTSPTGEQEPPAGDYSHVDIQEAWIGGETEETIQVGVTMGSADNQGVGPFSWWQRGFIYVYFALDNVEYRVASLSGGCYEEDQARGQLQVLDRSNGFYRGITCLDTTVDGTSFIYTVPKAEVVDADHVPLRYDDTLQGFYAEAFAMVAPGIGGFWIVPQVTEDVVVRDRAPDSGFGPIFRAVLGTTGVGDVHLLIEEPVRVSNGEATTIVYELDLLNDGTEEDVILLQTKGVPGDWTVRVPSKLTVAPGETVRFPVILSMPFTHNHGTTELFEVHAESSNNPDHYSVAELGVFWTEIPQPAGHHNKMYLHSANPEAENPFEQAFLTLYGFTRTWFNPLPPGEDPDPDADDEPVPAYFNTFFFPGNDDTANTHRAFWDFPLSPALLIGLDFDMDRSGGEDSYFATVIEGSAPAENAHIVATLRYCDPGTQDPDDDDGPGGGQGFGCPGEWVDIATGVSGKQPLNRGQLTEFVAPLDIKPVADILPYKRDANLHLNVQLVSDAPQNANLPEPKPLMHVDDPQTTVLVLPLVEYHDPVDQAFEDVGTLKIEALDEFEKPVNPGEVTYFRFTVENAAEAEQDVAVGLEGVNQAWAQFLEGDEMTLDAGEERNLTLEVAVPIEAVAGERAELFVIVESVDDPNVVAVSRLRASVVDPAEQDVEDEAGKYAVEEGGGSPGVGTAALAMTLVAVALLVERRRRV